VRLERLGRLLGQVPRSPALAHSALLVPVPEAEPLLGSLRGASAGGPGLPPHVTIVYPFLPAVALDEAVTTELSRIVAGHRAFEFSLTGLGTFPGVVWLRPEPDQPFVALGDSVLARWPTLSRYEGRYAEVVPHLTVGRGRLRRSWRSRIETAVPIAARARAVLLMAEDPGGRWEVRGRFPLGPPVEDRPQGG